MKWRDGDLFYIATVTSFPSAVDLVWPSCVFRLFSFAWCWVFFPMGMNVSYSRPFLSFLRPFQFYFVILFFLWHVFDFNLWTSDSVLSHLSLLAIYIFLHYFYPEQIYFPLITYSYFFPSIATAIPIFDPNPCYSYPSVTSFSPCNLGLPWPSSTFFDLFRPLLTS